MTMIKLTPDQAADLEETIGPVAFEKMKKADMIDLADKDEIVVSLFVPYEMEATVRGQPVYRDMRPLPENALDKIFSYGFQRINNDAGAISREKDESDEDFEERANKESLAKANKKWDALVAGTIRIKTARESDPAMARAMANATAKVIETIRDKFELSDKDKLPEEWDAKAIRAKAKQVLEQNPSWLEEAKKDIAKEAALKESVTIEL